MSSFCSFYHFTIIFDNASLVVGASCSILHLYHYRCVALPYGRVSEPVLKIVLMFCFLMNDRETEI